MPSEGTVRGWARDDRDGFGARYRQARDLQLDFWADEILDIADEANADPRDRQVRIDTRKWLMSKLAPRRYGDRLLHAGDPEMPMRHRLEKEVEAAIQTLSGKRLDALEAFAEAMLEKKEGR
jgi:terminase small subunit-like protein